MGGLHTAARGDVCQDRRRVSLGVTQVQRRLPFQLESLERISTATTSCPCCAAEPVLCCVHPQNFFFWQPERAPLQAGRRAPPTVQKRWEPQHLQLPPPNATCLSDRLRHCLPAGSTATQARQADDYDPASQPVRASSIHNARAPGQQRTQRRDREQSAETSSYVESPHSLKQTTRTLCWTLSSVTWRHQLKLDGFCQSSVRCRGMQHGTRRPSCQRLLLMPSLSTPARGVQPCGSVPPPGPGHAVMPSRDATASHRHTYHDARCMPF